MKTLTITIISLTLLISASVYAGGISNNGMSENDTVVMVGNQNGDCRFETGTVIRKDDIGKQFNSNVETVKVYVCTERNSRSVQSPRQQPEVRYIEREPVVRYIEPPPPPRSYPIPIPIPVFGWGHGHRGHHR